MSSQGASLYYPIATPRLEIYPKRIQSNAQSILERCQAHGASVAFVTKVLSAHPALVRAFMDAGASELADSRVENLRRIREIGFNGKLLLLRAPALSQAQAAVEVADTTCASSLATLEALGSATTFLGYAGSQALKRRHKVILMVDVGDLREGVWPDRAGSLLQKAKEIPGIEVVGLGCNLACFGGVIPTPTNMNMLLSLRDECQKIAGLELSIISGGNSSGLPLLFSGNMPKGINHFRIGEAAILGRNVIDRSPLPGTRQDTVIAVGEVIEVERKASKPIGERGQDAFGGSEEFEDRGMRRRAILNLGRQDVAINGITPIAEGIEVLGGSSDHLILDVENAATPIEVGTQVAFYPNYGALLALSTSPYVAKVTITER